MTATTYTFHAAYNHEILATANPVTLNTVAAVVARDVPDGSRVYVHNGRGVVAAGLCRGGVWHDTLRDNYAQFDDKARDARDAEGHPNN